jgi:hypothetical protein
MGQSYYGLSSETEGESWSERYPLFPYAVDCSTKTRPIVCESKGRRCIVESGYLVGG